MVLSLQYSSWLALQVKGSEKRPDKCLASSPPFPLLLKCQNRSRIKHAIGLYRCFVLEVWTLNLCYCVFIRRKRGVYGVEAEGIHRRAKNKVNAGRTSSQRSSSLTVYAVCHCCPERNVSPHGLIKTSAAGVQRHRLTNIPIQISWNNMLIALQCCFICSNCNK